MEEEKIIFCKSGGCTAKLGAGVLEHILRSEERRVGKECLA